MLIAGFLRSWSASVTLLVLGAALVAAAWSIWGSGAGTIESLSLGATTAGAAGVGVLVSATPLGDADVAICVLDTARDRLLVYLADTKRSRLRLVAARDISADWSLSDWNNDPPLPKEIRARVEKAAEAGRPATPAPRPDGSP